MKTESIVHCHFLSVFYRNSAFSYLNKIIYSAINDLPSAWGSFQFMLIARSGSHKKDQRKRNLEGVREMFHLVSYSFPPHFGTASVSVTVTYPIFPAHCTV